MIFVVLMGAFCVTGEYGINVINCLMFSVMCIICSIFEVIACVMYFQHSKYAIFDTKAPTMVLTAQIIFLSSPLLLLIAGGVSYSIYADCRDRGVEAPSGAY